MRQFIVLGHTAPITPNFSLDDTAGGAGRLDVLCRCVNTTFLLSHAIRTDTRLHLVMQDELTITFDGSSLRYLTPDERNIASLIQRALEATDQIVGEQPVESTPGITITRKSFDSLLSEAVTTGTVIQLHENAPPITEISPPPDPVFVLSDHQDFTVDEQARLDRIIDEQVRLGPERVHADHAITITHHYLDTNGYQSY